MRSVHACNDDNDNEEDDDDDDNNNNNDNENDGSSPVYHLGSFFCKQLAGKFLNCDMEHDKIRNYHSPQKGMKI